MAVSAPIGVAIIGGGIFAREEHLPAVEKSDLLTLKAVWSRSLSSAQSISDAATKTKPDLYSSDTGASKTFQSLLQRSDIDAVIIALPITSQPEYIEAALTAGKHVLAEKPIGPDVATGKRLIKFYQDKAAAQGLNFSIAENFRFIPSITYAADEARKLGKVQQFSVKVMSLMSKDNKYYNTAWRTVPEYQGGFLLDGGVHHAAATRLFLSGESAPTSVSALSSLAQPHLPPIDTVMAVVKTKAGGIGTYQQSAGSRISAFEWDVACEGGRVQMVGQKITVTPAEGESTVKEFPRTSGVAEEVVAWAESLQSGKPNPLQSAKEALADLEFLEKIFRSGESNGASQTYELQ